MHDKHLGTDKVCYGSVIFRLIHVLMAGTVEENLRQLLGDIKDGYMAWDVEPQNRFTSIRLSMISKTGAIKLPHHISVDGYYNNKKIISSSQVISSVPGFNKTVLLERILGVP